MARLLLIDDAAIALGETLSRPPLADAEWIVEHASWSSFAFETDRQRPDLILAATAPMQSRTLDFFAWLHDHPVRSPTIAVLPQDVHPEFLSRCFAAVDDLVLCPFRPEELRHRISRILGPDYGDATRVRDKLNSEHGLAHLVGSDAAFVREIRKIPLAARTECEVLISGETGTGKELCARAIHHLSRRSNRPFVAVDCGALPDQLFENEMFGHERGAFTDAHRAQKGLVGIAEGGTLFLDEIDSLTLRAQSKLLRFLQDRTYKPLGAERFTRADVRIMAASNKDLQHAVDENAFRSDLFFRINVLRLHMIPVRERRGDIPLLAEHFLDVCCAEMRCPRKQLSASSLQLLVSFEWHGNIRELHNMLRAAIVFCEGPQILPSHLIAQQDVTQAGDTPMSFRNSRAMVVHAFERRYVEDMLRRHHGNITRAAREAGQDRRVFGRLVKRLSIDPRSCR